MHQAHGARDGNTKRVQCTPDRVNVVHHALPGEARLCLNDAMSIHLRASGVITRRPGARLHARADAIIMQHPYLVTHLLCRSKAHPT